ncbi:MAG: MBL fold metallo-hydrolase, partial [Pseudomonadota bacterium]
EEESTECGSLRKLSITDRLSLINLIHEGMRHGGADSPVAPNLYEELWNLVDTTVSGAKIDKLNGNRSTRGFKTFEINSEAGENLGRMNMLYLNKPVPCFYLVYVEVGAPFRNKGLGNLILKEFRNFLIEKSAIGVLDNIIPREDPTFEIYRKLDWIPFREVSEFAAVSNGSDDAYMIYVPPSLSGKDLKDSIVKLVHHIRRKRPAIDMRDNEFMVQRTIEEFKELYQALLTYFSDQIASGNHDSLMRFMFTRYITKLLGFRRRISQLLGYTGGESMEQISLDHAIREIPAQSYGPIELKSRTCFVAGDRKLWLLLPEQLKSNPARYIEALPNYNRPSFVSWLQQNRKTTLDSLTLGEMIDLGFDPTRLKEIKLNGADFIFERIQLRSLNLMEAKRELLSKASEKEPAHIFRTTKMLFNPPLLIIRDRGNGYVLRKKVPGIHWEEAIEQMQTCSALKQLNNQLGIERIITRTVARAAEKMKETARLENQDFADPAGIFVSWDICSNQPKLVVDMASCHVETVWIS